MNGSQSRHDHRPPCDDILLNTTPTNSVIFDGLHELAKHQSLQAIMEVIEKTARWVNPDTFKYLPLWYPEYARGAPLYKVDWETRSTNTNKKTLVSSEKFEGNTRGNTALTQALGLRSKQRPNWSCCHIWGLDDPKYQRGNLVVQDRRFYSCIANMVLLPSPLKAFTDVIPEVKMMLRVCAFQNYGWRCDHEAVSEEAEKVVAWSNWQDYPKTWPKPGQNSTPLGTMPFSDTIRRTADRRMDRIKSDLDNAGTAYPREAVKDALEFWKISL